MYFTKKNIFFLWPEAFQRICVTSRLLNLDCGIAAQGACHKVDRGEGRSGTDAERRTTIRQKNNEKKKTGPYHKQNPRQIRRLHFFSTLILLTSCELQYFYCDFDITTAVVAEIETPLYSIIKSTAVQDYSNNTKCIIIVSNLNIYVHISKIFMKKTAYFCKESDFLLTFLENRLFQLKTLLLIKRNVYLFKYVSV